MTMGSFFGTLKSVFIWQKDFAIDHPWVMVTVVWILFIGLLAGLVS